MKASQIQVRRMSFDVERGAGGLWNPKRPELSHTLNAFQLALPYLEPYFIDAIRQGVERIDDAPTKTDALAFCAQEANHSRQHKRYCRFLQQRYPRLAEYEYAIQQSLVKSRQDDSLEWRLAYTAGYEAITAQLSRWMLRSSEKWFDGADEHFAAMMMWHAAEEIEHRHVAWDVFRAVTKDYRLRAKGLFGALKKTYADMAPVVSYMLEVDGYAKRLDSRVRRLGVRLDCVVELGPVMFHYLAPGYHPSKETEPPEFAAWLRRQESVANGALADESAER